jgi:hypothetical protein
MLKAKTQIPHSPAKHSSACSGLREKQGDCQKNGGRKISGFYISDSIFLTAAFEMK